jgi:hypothetical protein
VIPALTSTARFLRSISARVAAYSGLIMYFNWQLGASRIQLSGMVAVSWLNWNVIVSTDAEEAGRLMFDVLDEPRYNFNQSTRERNRKCQTISLPSSFLNPYLRTVPDVGSDTSFQTSLANAIAHGLINQGNVGASTPCPRCRPTPRPPLSNQPSRLSHPFVPCPPRYPRQLVHYLTRTLLTSRRMLPLSRKLNPLYDL